MGLARVRWVVIKCPRCGRSHRVEIDSPGYHTVRCSNHDVIIYVDEHLMVREVKTAETRLGLGLNLRLVEGKEDLIPSFVNREKLLRILRGEIEPSDEDWAIIRMLLRIGVLEEISESERK